MIILKPRTRQKMGGISRSTLWRIQKSDTTFPVEIRLGGALVGFIEAEIDAWIEGKRAEAAAPKPAKTMPRSPGRPRKSIGIEQRGADGQ